MSLHFLRLEPLFVSRVSHCRRNVIPSLSFHVPVCFSHAVVYSFYRIFFFTTLVSDEICPPTPRAYFGFSFMVTNYKFSFRSFPPVSFPLSRSFLPSWPFEKFHRTFKSFLNGFKHPGTPICFFPSSLFMPPEVRPRSGMDAFSLWKAGTRTLL